MSGSASAPASSANLGPGFDTLGLALELRCRVTAEEHDEWQFVEGGSTITPPEGNLVVRAVEAAVGRPMRLHITNEVPRSRGLGSSAAVTASAACASIRALGGTANRDDIFDLVTELEGHADNAAAAVYGGLVLVRGSQWRALGIAASLRFVVGVPDDHLSTHMARAALPPVVGMAAAARNMGRLGFLIEGLRTGDPDALRLASGDELHEEHRAALSPMTTAIMDAATKAGGFHAAWSGAGPAALIVTDDERLDAVIGAVERVLDGSGKAMVLDVATDGLL